MLKRVIFKPPPKRSKHARSDFIPSRIVPVPLQPGAVLHLRGDFIFESICFLIANASDRHEIPTRLLNLYFEFFTSEVKKNQNKMSQKILLSLLTGVNRAFPFSHREGDDSIEQNINHLFKLVHNGTFIVALQALSFLFQGF